jgi:hypothetical protein
MSADDADRFGDPWLLTKFHASQTYLDLVRSLSGGKVAPGRVQRAITVGLNRAMTGYLTDTNDEIWLTRPSGDVHGQAVPLLIDSPIPWTGRYAKATIDGPSFAGQPAYLRIVEREDIFGSLKLSPTMFEFLHRVSTGALPGSFGSKCLQEVRTFQITTYGKLEAVFKKMGEGMRLQAIRLRPGDGALEARTIKLLEDA